MATATPVTDMIRAAGLRQQVLEAIRDIEPGADRGALVGCSELRREFPRTPKAEFDRAVCDLARAGVLCLHRHDYVTSLTPQERDEMVWCSTDPATDTWSKQSCPGAFFVGVALRQS